IDSQRDPGNAVITMAVGTTLNTGSGTLTVELRDGAGLSNPDSGPITLQAVNARSLSVTNMGNNPGSDINAGGVTTVGSQTYSNPSGITTITGNLASAGNPITFTDSVVVTDGVTVDAGTSSVNFASAGTQTLRIGIGTSLGNLLHNGNGTLQLINGLNVTGNFTAGAGTVAASLASIGVVNVGGNVAFSSSATVSILIDGSDSSQFMAGGTIDLGGSTLSLVFNSDPVIGNPF